MAKRGVVVGFYKEHGKTKPITKSNAKINQRKNIVGPSKFRGVKPGRSPEVSQCLEDLLEKLSILENQKADLLIRKQLLEKARKDTTIVDKQLAVQERSILRQKVLIKKLGSTTNLS